MYAIVTIGGRQVRAEKGESIRVPKMNIPEGEKVSFNEVLLVYDDKQVKVGAPTIEGYSVRTRVLSHGKGPKIVVFKMKRRKGYRKKQGHRQGFTELLVEDIIFSSPRASGKTKAVKAALKEDSSQKTDTTKDTEAKSKRRAAPNKPKAVSGDKAAPSASKKSNAPAEEVESKE